MKKKFLTLSAFIICAIMAVSSCNGGTTATSSSASAEATGGTSGEASNKATTTANSDTSDASETTVELADVTPTDTTDKLNTFMHATLGDKIDFQEYRIFQKEDGTKIYFANGRYLFVMENTVIEVREAVTVANPNATVYDVLLADDDFNVENCKAYFYRASDGAVVDWDLSSRLTSEVSQCVVEYVDWKDDAETTGILHSYIFSYNDAPIKVVAVYSKAMEEAAKTATSEATAEPEVTTTADTDIDAETTTTEAEKPTNTATTTAKSE